MFTALVALCATIAPVPVKKPALEITIALDKVTYKRGDKVTLSFVVKNVSTAELWIGDGFLAPETHEVGPGRHFELMTTDANGTDLRFWSAAATEGRTSGARKVFKLKPGDEYRGTVVLSDGGFATVKTDQRHKFGTDAAEYKLRLVYQVNPKSHFNWEPPKDFDKEMLWNGVITSNAVTLTFK